MRFGFYRDPQRWPVIHLEALIDGDWTSPSKEQQQAWQVWGYEWHISGADPEAVWIAAYTYLRASGFDDADVDLPYEYPLPARKEPAEPWNWRGRNDKGAP